MKIKKSIAISIVVVFGALSFGLGALSGNLYNQVLEALEFRAQRALVWRDMLGTMSPTARDYFDGHYAGHVLSRSLLLDEEPAPHFSAEFIQGMTDAMAADKAMIDYANTFGTLY